VPTRIFFDAFGNLGRVERLQIMLTEDELAVIDDWRFERRSVIGVGGSRRCAITAVKPLVGSVSFILATPSLFYTPFFDAPSPTGGKTPISSNI
jgi:hypothetical protein